MNPSSEVLQNPTAFIPSVVTLTGEEVVHLLKTALGTPQTHPSPIAPVPKSLLARFSLVEKDILLLVAQHDLSPMDLHKLDWEVAFDRDFLSEDTVAYYPSLTSLLNPLMIYFQILAYTHATSQPDLAVGGFKYISHLCQLEEVYEWDAVLRYHMAYHAERLHEMRDNNYSGWGPLSAELYARHLERSAVEIYTQTITVPRQKSK